MFEPYLENYEAFLRDELEFVRDLYPPFVSLARILIADKKQEKAEALTADIVEKLHYFDEVDIVGYGKAPVERIANKYRYTVLLRSKKKVPLLKALHSVNCRGIEIDMDPVEFS
jgi:primosomal protein N' (replication factor Y)